MNQYILEGTAQEVGEQIFRQVLLPILHQQSHMMSPQHLAHVYVGIIGGLYGSMAADFGKESTQLIIDSMQKQFGRVILTGGGRVQ